ncbi:hypothetical protein N7490_002786 [Penicillium lividum]|nr:hypothetical protein N7490_002786 [Penicillium lividum]
MSLAQKQKPGDQFTNFNTGLPEDVPGYETPASASDRDTKSSPGTLVVNDEGTSYIDSANWRAILEEINGVKEYLDEQENNSNESAIEEDPFDDSTPVLLLGMAKKVTKQEMLIDIPVRSIADRLVSRFLKTFEPSIVVIHVPTFRKEYEQFWTNPHDVSFTWIALLYAIMALSISLHHRSEEPLPMINAECPMTMWDKFRRRAAQCLVQANYLIPGKYKPEAVFLYTLSEFLRSQDTQIGVSYLLGITIRLALRMGYHRDPSYYPNLSAFEGEMRRRLWALICQLDILVSFQNGLPRTIQPYYSDSEIPSNLLDADFDENCTKLPPGRPDEERTACSYTRAKSRLMAVFGQICDSAYTREPVSYDEIMAIDRRLEVAHDQMPSFFRARPMSESIGDQTDLILCRYSLDLIYQKSRIVLHRRYITETHGKYASSRKICIDAASATLRHHADIWGESLPGGQLYSERFLLNSLQTTDFNASAMVLCLILSHDNDSGDSPRMQTQEHKEILLLLENTYAIFKQTPRRSTDTQRAFVALGIMLSRVRGRSLESLTSKVQEHTSAIESIAPVPLDWRMYDGQMYGFDTANQDNLWSTGHYVDSNGLDFTLPPDIQ